MGRPILSPGKKLTGGKFRPVTGGIPNKWCTFYLFIYLFIYTIFQEGDIFSSTASLP